MSKSHDDVLYVSHDYYSTVTSKLRMMHHTVQANKDRSHLYFATPVEYDQFGDNLSEIKYQEAEANVKSINPNATIIRSDVQDGAESIAYINMDKNLFEDLMLTLSYSQKFRPKILSTNHYVNFVAKVMRDRLQGKHYCLVGKE